MIITENRFYHQASINPCAAKAKIELIANVDAPSYAAATGYGAGFLLAHLYDALAN